MRLLRPPDSYLPDNLRTGRQREEAFWRAARSSSEFFMGTGDVFSTLEKLVGTLDELKIPYAIAGAMALNVYGYRRQTVDVDLLMTREGLERLKAALVGRGFVEKFAGSKGLRDAENQVAVDILISGDYPGDGLPKPVRFPDPSVAERLERGSYLPLKYLVELKLASGMSAKHRLKDLADVQELIKATHLSREFVEELDPYVRSEFLEQWEAAQVREVDH